MEKRKRRIGRGQKWVSNGVIHPDVVLFIQTLVRNGHNLRAAWDDVWPDDHVPQTAIYQFLHRLKQNPIVRDFYQECCDSLNRERQVLQYHIKEISDVLERLKASGDWKNYIALQKVLLDAMKAHSVIKPTAPTFDLTQIGDF